MMLAWGCTDDVLEPADRAPEFVASFENPGTRTYVDDGLQLFWTADDRLSIFTDTSNQQYAFKGKTGDKSGTFKIVDGGGTAPGSPLQANYAVYPYSEATAISDDGVLSLALPATQNYVAGSFAPGANTMVAVTRGSSDSYLPFQNICGYLVLQFYGSGTVKSITLRGNNGEKLSGAASVTAVYGESPVVEMKSSADDFVMLDCGEGIPLSASAENADSFWICIPPVTFGQGFTITVQDTDGGSFEKSVTSSRTIQRNIVNKMVPLELSFSKPEEQRTFDKVMIMYCAGFNDLYLALENDIESLTTGTLPAKDDDAALIVISHLGNKTPTSPIVSRLYKNSAGKAVRDTLLSLSSDMTLTRPDVMAGTLNYVAEHFKSDNYGLIFSSHATGWLPVGYYDNPSAYTSLSFGSGGRFRYPSVVPYTKPDLPGPQVKSVGEETEPDGNIRGLNLQDFASSLPYHFEYIIFDACLMGGVEVAYELKDKCDYVGFSPTEILADGLNYKNITKHLLKSGKADLSSMTRDYFIQYASQTGYMKSATFTIVDCSKLESLASVCRSLFSRYRGQIDAVNASEIQRYFRSSKHWFYDLEDILVKSGISSSEKSVLSSALSACAIYKVHTPSFMSGYYGFDINTYCGLSMYLPCKGSTYLDNFYKTLSWNKATSLVQP